MPKPLKLAVAAIALLTASWAGAAPAWSDPSWPRVDARQARQQARIAAGVADGAITPHEQRWLLREQRGIARVERRAEADGRITWHERQRLERLQDRSSRHIARQSHDAQVAWR